jgi:aspartyl/asparaginyl-tRNA synthetase
MAFATHKFFNERGFVYVHTPLITGGDCEGAGEMFSVTTMLPKGAKGDLPRCKDGSIDYSKDVSEPTQRRRLWERQLSEQFFRLSYDLPSHCASLCFSSSEERE